MFGVRERKGPSRAFTHTPECKIVKADPGVEIPWQEVERGHWQAICQCGAEHVRERPAERRSRLDPLDPSTSRHAPQCEHRDTTDPAVIRAILKVRDGTGSDDYWWVECHVCDRGWQVPHYGGA
jgi:hypothetical protein